MTGKGPVESAIDAVTARAERAEKERDERLRVNVGLVAENKDLRKRLRAGLCQQCDAPLMEDEVAVAPVLAATQGCGGPSASKPPISNVGGEPSGNTGLAEGRRNNLDAIAAILAPWEEIYEPRPIHLAIREALRIARGNKT